MKKITAFFLAVAIIAMTGCSKLPTEPDAPDVTEPAVTETTAPTTEPEKETPLVQNGTFDVNTFKWGTFFSG